MYLLHEGLVSSIYKKLQNSVLKSPTNQFKNNKGIFLKNRRIRYFNKPSIKKEYG